MSTGVFRPYDEEILSREDVKVRSTSSTKTGGQVNDSMNMFEMVAFWISVGASQAVGLAIVGLIIYFGIQYGGFAWTSNADLQFNYHPVLMVIGLVFLYGEAIIIYRVFSFLPKMMLKIIHAALHAGAIILSIVGLVAIFENHRRTNKADLYSLHSWIGLTTFILFVLQYTMGFISFLFPGAPLTLRARMMPYHRFLGIGIFIMAIASALMGLTQKLLWTSGYSSRNVIPKGAVGNSIGMLMTVFGFLIVFLGTNYTFRRRPLPSELPGGTQQHGTTLN